jgi:tRNA pseudouridine synthase 10
VHSARSQLLTPHFFLLHLVTSAGTYVKEFVHGDLGRTRPSVGELLSAGGGARVAADILMLDVTGIVAGARSGGGKGAESEEDEEEGEDGD